MTLVINSIEIEGSLTINGVDVTSDVQSVGEKVANAGGVASFAADLASSKPTAGVVDRVFISTDSGIISIDDGSTWNNILPAYSGDVASSVGGTTLTLATVNSNTGTFGSTNTVPVITVNGKGLITSVTTANLTKSSVGLGNVANVDTTNASNISSGTLANARLSTNLSQLGGLTPTAGDYFQFNGSAIVNVTAATVKTSLSLTKGDVGLGNVANVDTTNATNITSGTLANARLSANLSQIGGIVKSNGDIISVVGGVYTARTISQYKTDLSLNNVANVDTTNASNISSGTLANARLTTNLSQLGGITFATSDVMQFNGTTLTNVSMNSLKTSLSLTKSDVGLGNVANVDTTNAANISSGTLANARLSANLSQIGGLTLTSGDYLQYNGSVVTNVTPAAVKASLTLTKGDVGLGSVQNVDTTNASNISSGTLANARLTTNLSQLGGITFTTNDIAYYNGTTLAAISPTSYKSLLSLTKSDVGLSNVLNSVQVINAGNALSISSGISAIKPAAGTNGRFYYTTDLGTMSFDDGTVWNNILPAYTGDVTSSLGGTVMTLPTVNSNVGTFNNLQVNGKGQVIAASNANYLGDSGANGLVVRTALNVTTARTITNVANQTAVTNGDGTGGNPTIGLADNPIIPGTASMTMPSGTTAQRDTPTNGQMRYNTTLGIAEISDAGVYRPFGKVAQFITGNIAQTTGTTILPYDATTPTSTEGFQIWTANITPLYTTSTIVVIFNIFTEVSTAANTMTVALFNGTTVIATNSGYTGIANTATSLSIHKSFTSGTTSAITLSARSGPSVASTMYVNRGNTETMGGTTTTSYIIMEIV